MRTTDLARLIRSCQHGDQKALCELVRRFERPIYAYAARMAPRMAEDVCQETFVRLFRALPRYRDEGRFRAWVFRLATSALIDATRARKRRPVSLEPEIIADPSPDPLAGLERAEQLAELAEAVQGLPFDQRQVVVLRTQSGLTFREIAEALDAPLGTVLARMHRAIVILRRKIH